MYKDEGVPIRIHGLGFPVKIGTDTTAGHEFHSAGITPVHPLWELITVYINWIYKKAQIRTVSALAMLCQTS